MEPSKHRDDSQEKRSVLIKTKNSKSTKDKLTLNSYVKSQEKNRKGVGQFPSSARNTSKDQKSKTLLGKKSRHESKAHKYSASQFDEYIHSLASTQKPELQSPTESAQKLADMLQEKASVKDAIDAEKVRCAKDFKIRKGSTTRGKSNDINQFLKQNKYVKVNRESSRASGYDVMSDMPDTKFMQRQGSAQSIQSPPPQFNQTETGIFGKAEDYTQHARSQQTLQTVKAIRPQTAKHDTLKAPISSINGKTLIKIPEDYTVLQNSQWRENQMTKSVSSQRFTPQLFSNKGREVYSRETGRNFINRIEKRAMSATRNVQHAYKGSSLSLDAKPKYKMLVLNWGQELEKHDKILQKFHIFAPLKYDIDATFHKLFSKKSKDLIKQKLKLKKMNKLIKAGALENQIDLMFATDNAYPDKHHAFEQDELLMSSKYEESENKEQLRRQLQEQEYDIINIQKDDLHEVQEETGRTGEQQPSHEEGNDREAPSPDREEDKNRESKFKNQPKASESQQDEGSLERDANQHRASVSPKSRLGSQEADLASDYNSVYSSPFKGDKININEDNMHAAMNADVPEREFPDKDIQLRIRDKDIVFIYEIDDMIKELISNNKRKSLGEHPEILDVLNRFSKLFRHYIRYRVVDIGDLIGGLFLDGFWKTLLITIDNILQSVDQRCKERIVKLQKQYSKIIDQMNQKLADKDREMRAMDKTEFIKDLQRKLEMIKEEKITYQKLAQDKLDFIEMLTSNDKKYPGFTGAKDLYDTARELIEAMHLEKTNRIVTVNKLDDVFQIGKKLRKSLSVETQTDFSTITPIKIKDIVLPNLNDYQLMAKYEHPFASTLRFLNQESVENEKRLTFKPYSVNEVFAISETILDRIGKDLLLSSQKYADEQALILKKAKSPKRRPRSPKRRGKKGAKDGDGLAVTLFRVQTHYPPLEKIYIQQLCDQTEGSLIKVRSKEVTFRTLASDLYQYCYSLKY